LAENRSVFDFVGQIAKILFDTLDSPDAKYYSKRIDFAYDNSNKTINKFV